MSGVDESGNKLEFYQCKDCTQLYWWGQKTESESKRFQSIFAAVEKELVEEEKKQQELLLKHLNSNNENIDNEIESNLNTFEKRRYLKLVPNLQTYFWKDITFNNPFSNGLKSACCENNMLRKEPNYTNKTRTFEGTLDYIFFSRALTMHNIESADDKDNVRKIGQNLVCRSGDVCLPSEDNGKGPYPNEFWWSDHLPIVATFEFKQ